jgi:tellurite resistance protein TerA
MLKLEKSGDSHQLNLEKNRNLEKFTISVNLDWEELQPQKRGLFGKKSAADLDLGCMYELKNGEKGVIQPVGKNFGSKTSSPYIFLDKDDRTGATAGENMYVFRPDLIDRVMFFALIYQGAPDFKSVQGRMVFNVSSNEQIYLELNNPHSNCPLCAAAVIKNTNNQISITKEEKYFGGHELADKYYKFGFRWVSGSK